MSGKKHIERAKGYLSNPIFWLVLIFLYGLIQIDLPPIDRHNWRQALTLMISRNFYLLNNSIFYPQYDIGGATEGIIPTEFPIYNYITALSYHLFGLNDWSARLINWIVTCFGFYYFFKTINKCFSKQAALMAMLMMTCSVMLVYGRKAMPDTFALSLTIIGVFYYWRYLEKTRWLHLILGCLFMTLGVLSKIPMISFTSLLIIPLIKYRKTSFEYGLLGFSSAVFLSCIGVWYFHWMPYLESNFGNKLIWPVSLSEGWTILLDNWSKVGDRLLNSTFHNPVFIVLAIAGFVVVAGYKRKEILFASLAYFVSVLIFICKTGHVYHLHDYYTISIVPLICLLVAAIWDWIALSDKWKWLIGIALLIPSFVNEHSIIQERHEDHFQRLPKLIDSLTFNPADKIMVSGGSAFNPTMMYFTGRKGWSASDEQIVQLKFIEERVPLGLKYIIVDKHRALKFLPLPVLLEDKDFIIYLSTMR